MNISTNVYQKAKDTHPYLHWTSEHPLHLQQDISYCQASRLRRMLSSPDTLKKRITYTLIISLQHVDQGCNGPKLDVSLYNDTRRILETTKWQSTNRILLVTTFNTHTTLIAETARRIYNLLQSKERLACIFKETT